MTFVRQWCALYVGLLTLLLLGCGDQNRPIRFYLPKGYSGWFVIYYGVRDKEPLKVNQGVYVVTVPPNGKFKTSTQPQIGILKQTFYDGDESRPLDGPRPNDPDNIVRIWAGTFSGGDYEQTDNKGNKIVRYDNPARMTYFVGTEKQWNGANRSRPK